MVEPIRTWSNVRCLFESPILDQHKWDKIPGIPADAFILDLEDAVPVGGKEQARIKVVEFLSRPEYFDGRLTVPRANALDTPWGRDDIIALAVARTPIIMLPKVNRPSDIDDVLALFAEYGQRPDVLASIESARGVLDVEAILGHEAVVAATFGPGDLYVDAGMALYEPDGSMNPGLLYPKVKTVLAGAASQVPVLSIAYMPDVKDADEVRRRVAAERRLGFSGCCAFYPPHVELINAEFTPSPEVVQAAIEVVGAYEEAVAQGKPAVQLANGKVVLMHQYLEASKTISRAR